MDNLELCLRIIDTLNAHERAQVARKLNTISRQLILSDREKECMEESDKLCDAILEATGVIVRSKSRDAYAVNARRYVCKVLRDMGFSLSVIGRALNMDHSSVLFHCKKAEDSEQFPRFYPEYHSIKNKVREKLYSSD